MPKEVRKGRRKEEISEGKKQILYQNPTVSVITLNIYGTNGSILKAEIAKKIEKQDLTMFCLGEMHFKKDTDRSKVSDKRYNHK